MGCGSSSQASTSATDQPQVVATVDAQLVNDQPQGQNGAGKGKGKGKGKGTGKFQIRLGGKFEDYADDEDMVLKRAFLVGLPNAQYSLRGQKYRYDFTTMVQRNLDSGKERDIRPPSGMAAPKTPLLPAGQMIVIKVKPGQAGQTIDVPDPIRKGNTIKVNVPAGAKAGQKMAVPIPAEGETVETVQEKQKKHSTTYKVAMGTAGVAAVAGLAVGGVILGDHLSGGAVAEAAGDAFGDGAEDAMAAATDWTAGAVEDAGEWVVGAGEDAGDWIGDAAGDVGDVAEDAVDWLGDAAEDVGDFVMDLF